MKLSGVPVFDIFEQYSEDAPKNLEEMTNLIQKCRESNRIDLAEFLEDWVENVKEKVSKEWTTEV